MDDTLKSFLSGVAPTVASALLGPLGGVAVAGLTKILGIDGGTVADVTKAISDGRVTPEQVAEIRKLELQYQADEKERGFRYAELEFKGLESAHKMQIATNSTTPTVLTYIITAGFFGTLYMVMLHPEMKESAPLMIMLGALGAEFASSCKFWFGTTNGSLAKSNLLAQSQPGK
jgi:hypothetical protein